MSTSFFDTFTSHLGTLTKSYQNLPRWQQVTIGAISIMATYKIYKILKPKPKNPEYYPNVPHYTAKKVVNCNNILGECCLWDDRKKLLCWIDNLGKKYWTYDPNTKESKSYDLPEEPGSFALCEDGSLFFCFGKGPAFYDINTKQMSKRIFEFEPNRRTKMNDGRCDRQGNFVVGGVIAFDISAKTVFSKITQFIKNIYVYFMGKKSAIYRINKDLSCQMIVKDIMCANSICFGLNNDRMYYTDSFKKGIWKMDYFNDKTVPKHPTVFSDKYKGFADGSNIDANGNLWNAHFGIGKVGCIDKDTGEVIMVVDVPEKCVTCVTFGGDNLDILFVTTLNGAKFGRNKDNDDVGNLYAVKLSNVKGVKESRFGGTAQQIK